MTSSAKLAVYIFLQLSDTPRGLNEGEGNECVCLSWMDFRELQFISARRDKCARIQRFKMRPAEDRRQRQRRKFKLIFCFWRISTPSLRSSVRQTLRPSQKRTILSSAGRNWKRSEVGRLRTNVQFCCVKAQLMPQLKQNVGSLRSTERCPAVKSLIKSWFRYESSLWLCSWRARGQRGVGAEARCFKCDE